MNGQCFNCHADGLIRFEDRVRGDKKDPSAHILAHYPDAGTKAGARAHTTAEPQLPAADY